MTIFITLTNKLMNSNNKHFFDILFIQLTYIKEHDHQNLLDNNIEMIISHSFRLQLDQLFKRYAASDIDFLKILTHDQEPFLWNENFQRRCKIR
jgi:hypothetical protein